MEETYQILTLDCPSKLPTHDPPKFTCSNSSTTVCQRTHVTKPMVKCPSKYGMYIWLGLYAYMPIYLSIWLCLIPRISRKTQEKNLLYTRKRGKNKEQPSDTKQLTALYTQNSIALAHASHSEATQKPRRQLETYKIGGQPRVGWLVVVVGVRGGEAAKWSAEGKWLGRMACGQ